MVVFSVFEKIVSFLRVLSLCCLDLNFSDCFVYHPGSLEYLLSRFLELVSVNRHDL